MPISLIIQAAFSFLKNIPPKVWALIVLVLLIVAAYMYVASLKETIAEQEVQIAQLTAEKAVLEKSNHDLQAGIEEQNAAIKKLKKKGADLQNELDNLLIQKHKNDMQYEAELAKLRGEKVPVDCNEALQWHSNKMR